VTVARGDRLGLALGVSLALHALAALWIGGHTVVSIASAPVAPVTSVSVRVVAVPAPEPDPVAAPPPSVAAPPPPASAPPPPKPTPKPAPRSEPAPVSAPPAPRPETVKAAAPESAAPVEAEPATAPEVAAVAVPPVETGPSPDELLARYKALLLERIAAHKEYPALARRRGVEGDVVLRLSIDAAGRLAEIETPGRSPQVLAAQARRAAERAAPFPPPPGGPFRIDFTLRFDLDE